MKNRTAFNSSSLFNRQRQRYTLRYKHKAIKYRIELENDRF